MYDHADLAALQASSLRMQDWIRRQTYSPEHEKVLRRFSAWEVSEHILGIPQPDLRAAIAADPDLPRGEARGGAQSWFSLDEVNRLRQALRPGGRSLAPFRPEGKRAVRAAIANFKGGAGKSTVALHFAHAAALGGYRVLLVDFDPQATLSHAMGLTDVTEDATVWGIIAGDLARETRRMNAEAASGAASGATATRRETPSAILELGLDERSPDEFIQATPWSTIDMIPSCANAAFVEFASAQYRHLNPEWSFFAAVSRFLDALPDDAYDLILFDCPPAIGYQSMNAVFAADLLYIPSGPGYWEYDSTTSFIGQLSEALEDLSLGRETFPTGKISLPKAFQEIRFVLTRFEPGNDLHVAMFDAFRKVFGHHLCERPIEHTRAVEQSGRFLCSIYEIDYRDMTRETWKRARRSFDRAYAEFAEALKLSWEGIPESEAVRAGRGAEDAA